MSLVLIVFSGILSVVILYQLCHGSGGFMSGSQRRASTGINEAYGILEDCVWVNFNTVESIVCKLIAFQ